MSSTGSTADSPDPVPRASFACSLCRANKKGCDKALPACSSCSRLRRTCNYSNPAPTSTPRDYHKLVERVALLEDEISQYRTPLKPAVVSIRTNPASTTTAAPGESYSQSDDWAFPSSFFLDVQAFDQQGITAHKLDGPIPENVLLAIGDEMQVRTVVGAYFFSVSTWMAMVSRKRLYQDISVFSFGLNIDVALLILVMKLLNEKPPAGQQSPPSDLYAMTKDFYSQVESKGIGSVRLLQAGILLALYETGHSIYPAAYLSIGRCGRLGQAIGLHDTGGIPQLALEPQSWDEMEERRRVWWAVFILDRNINVGNPTRALALADARRGDYLPVDDKAWEQGERVASEPLFISTSPNIAAAPFARLGQASHLLGHVFTHINDRSLSPPVRLEEARQLIRAILALRSFLQPEIASEATKICVPIAVCYSALTLLYEHCTGVGATLVPEEKELQEMGATGLDNLVSEVISYAGHIQTIIAFYMDQASPLITTCLYKTAKRLIGLLNPDSLVALTFIKETLEKLSMRWSVAAEYLKMLDHIEAANLAFSKSRSVEPQHG